MIFNGYNCQSDPGRRIIFASDVGAQKIVLAINIYLATVGSARLLTCASSTIAATRLDRPGTMLITCYFEYLIK